MTVPMEEWGRRLSDATRTALEAGDFALARQLAREGDGQARSLAKEYTLMYRGLGITIRVLLPLLRDTALRAHGAGGGTNLAADAAALVRRFRNDLEEAKRRAWGELEGGAGPSGSLEEEMARAVQALGEGEARFEQEQTRLADEVVRAIEAGDAGRAMTLLRIKEQDQYLPLHDCLLRFMAESFAWVLRNFGEEELLRFHLATAEAQRPGIEKWEKMMPTEFAWTSVFLLKQHMGRVAIREDERKFTIDQSLCGSGGRMQLSGAYTGPQALPFVESPGPLTFGQPRLPVYCSHCAVWNGVATLQWFGRAHWVFEDAARADGGCRLHIYKRREDAPADYARMLMPAAGEPDQP